MKMTIAKAMRIRAELKKTVEFMSDRIKQTNIGISVPQKGKDAEDVYKQLAGAVKSPVPYLDGNTYMGYLSLFITGTKAIEDMNIAIEQVNKKVHELLFKEATYKSQLDLFQHILSQTRDINSVSVKDELTYKDGQQTVSKVTYLTKSMYINGYADNGSSGQTVYGSPLEMCRMLKARLAEVRDEITAYNSTTTIDVSIPEVLGVC